MSWSACFLTFRTVRTRGRFGTLTETHCFNKPLYKATSPSLRTTVECSVLGWKVGVSADKFAKRVFSIVGNDLPTFESYIGHGRQLPTVQETAGRSGVFTP